MSKHELDKEKEFGCPDCGHDHDEHEKQGCQCEHCQCDDCECEDGKECNCEHCECDDDCDCKDCKCEECDCEDGEDCACEHCHCGCNDEDQDCDCEDCDLEKETDDDEEEPYVGHFHEHPHHHDHKHEHKHDHKHEHKHEHKQGKVNEETLYYLEMAQRLKADFDNYKRRTEENTKQSYNLGVSYAVEKLLTVVDSVTQAKNKITDQNTLQGLDIIEKQCLTAFASLGVSKIECLEKPFDPNFHNAVMTVSDSAKPDNVVVDELQAGFMLGEKVIRHSVVRINKL